MKTQLILILLFSIVFIGATKRTKFKLKFYINRVALDSNKYSSNKVLIYSNNKSIPFNYRKNYNLEIIDSIVIFSVDGNLSILKSNLNDVLTTISDANVINFEYFNNMEKCYFCDSITKIKCRNIVLISTDDFSGFFICK